MWCPTSGTFAKSQRATACHRATIRHLVLRAVAARRGQPGRERRWGWFPPGDCLTVEIREPRVAANGPNGGRAQAPRVPACAAGTAGDPVRIDAGQVAPFGDSVTYRHDAQADHRDGRESAATAWTSRTAAMRARPVHRDPRDHSVDHLYGRPIACTEICKPRVAAHGPNGGRSTAWQQCTGLRPSAACGRVCGDGGRPRAGLR